MEYDYLLDTYDLSSDSDSNSKLNTTTNTSAQSDAAAAALGIDEAVVVKKRRPIAKLDDSRLLGSNGIPVLKAKLVPRMKFKGKGYERRDLTKLLSTYQIWAHGLFPKANFMDFIQLCKKGGSTAAMKVYRRQWIDEEKNKSISEALDEMYQRDKDNEEEGNVLVDDGIGSISKDGIINNVDDDDLFFNDDGVPQMSTYKPISTSTAPVPEEEYDVFDELDDIWTSVHKNDFDSTENKVKDALVTTTEKNSDGISIISSSHTKPTIIDIPTTTTTTSSTSTTSKDFTSSIEVPEDSDISDSEILDMLNS